jgi:UDP-N-acetylmuramate--alanine ligase
MNVENKKSQTSNNEKSLTFRRTNFVAGKGKYLIVEVDEYQRKFLSLFPKILVVNNVDEDHLDYFKDLAGIQSAFAEFAARVPEEGVIITDFRHPNITPIVRAARAIVIDYNSVPIDGLKLKFPGEYNRQNARAALAVACALGVDFQKAVKSLNDFSGTWRRFEYLGKTNLPTGGGALVYDDYAHNPQKIQAVLSGARELFPKNRIIAVFQPHLYSRTKTLLKRFAESFNDADVVVLAPIFPAREALDPAISSKILASCIKENYPDKMLRYIATFEEIAEFLEKESKEGDVILTIGAGDIYKVAERIIKHKT